MAELTVYSVLLPKDRTTLLDVFHRLPRHVSRICVLSMELSDRPRIMRGAFAPQNLMSLVASLAVSSVSRNYLN
jgi:hypothetical protein